MAMSVPLDKTVTAYFCALYKRLLAVDLNPHNCSIVIVDLAAMRCWRLSMRPHSSAAEQPNRTQTVNTLPIHASFRPELS